MKHILLGALLFGAASAIPRPSTHTLSETCTAQIVRDYELGFAYYAQPQLASFCPAGTVLRVRKTSTLNTRAAGAPYQPIQPETGAWELSKAGTTIPFNQRWTSSGWAWQFYSTTFRTWKTMRVLP